MTVRVVIADDHPVVLEGLEQLLRADGGFEVVARCGAGSEALTATLEHAPDVLLLDLRLPGQSGLEVVAALRRRGSAVPVVLLTAEIGDAEIREAVELGVRGLVLKETAPQQLLGCLQRVARGGRWFDDESVGRVLEAAVGRREAASPLSRRELEIVRLVGQGLRNAEIGARLYISEGTVKVHLHRIFQKLGVDRRAAVARYAVEQKLV